MLVYTRVIHSRQCCNYNLMYVYSESAERFYAIFRSVVCLSVTFVHRTQWVSKLYMIYRTAPFSMTSNDLEWLSKILTTQSVVRPLCFLFWALLSGTSALLINFTNPCFWQRIMVRAMSGKVSQPWRGSGGNWSFPVSFACLI